MRRSALLSLLSLLAGLLTPAALSQDGKEKAREEPEKSANATTRFFQGEVERLTEELDGAWMLLDYADPAAPTGAGQANGFVTFHDGFMTWLLAVDSAEDTFFGFRSFLVLESGAFRFRIDEQANLQLASLLNFTNNTVDGEVIRDQAGSAFEYIAHIDEGVLELRDPDGIVLTFRKLDSGEFPDSAVRKIEKGRSGTPAWDGPEPR
jgi:hypothetical protein